MSSVTRITFFSMNLCLRLSFFLSELVSGQLVGMTIAVSAGPYKYGVEYL